MNILYIGFFSLPDNDAAANRVMNNALALSELGHRVVFIDEQKEYPYQVFLHSKHNIGDFEVWSKKRPSGIIQYLKKMTSVSDIISIIANESFDVVIAYNYPSIALDKLRLYCNKRNIKILADCTEWYSGKEYGFPLNVLCAADSFYRMNIVQKKLDGIICISDFLYNFYKKSTNVVFIPPLVDINNAVWWQDIIHFSSNKLNLIYAGNPGKNKESLLPIVFAINNSKNKSKIILRVIGITKNKFLEIYSESLLDNCDLENVIFLGRLSHKDTLRYIKSSDFMVFTRNNNLVNRAGFSTKFVEAISCGTRVITNDTGMLKKYIGDNDFGYIVANDGLRNFFDDYNYKSDKKSIKNYDKFDYRLYCKQLADFLNKM